MRYLLDTNIIAEPTKPRPNQEVLDRLTQVAGDVAISSVTWHELWFGTEHACRSDTEHACRSDEDARI
jgi:predicted nucleic acid-binding protein